jgi:D-alanyl-D-alanine carboxypeptidase (penicillin-binding protein 5/6)
MVVVDAYDLETEIALKEEVDAEGNGIDLEVGEKVKVKDLLGAALVGSKNDAMYALAQNYPGGVQAFVESMDEKRADFGMNDTSVVNPIGLDDPEQYSTPRDIALLMIVAMREPVISDIVALPSYTVETAAGRQEIVYATNTLLTEVPGVVGGKTGYTAEAGLSLVTFIDDDPDFVTVVFNAEDRYEASKRLIEAVRLGYACR